MNKFRRYVLLFFFVCSLFISVFNSVSASEPESDLVEDSWNTKTPMNQARADFGAVVADGKIYAIGGYTGSDLVGTNERYDPVADTWTVLAPMPTPRGGFAVVAWQGKIYCMGGSSFNDQGRSINCRVNEIYDIASDSWSVKEMPVEYAAVGQVVNGQIFVMSAAGDELYMYDSVSDVWTAKTPMPPYIGAVNHLTATDGKLIVIFDCYVDSPNPSLSISPMVKAVRIYDPQTDTWSERRGTDTFFGSNFFVIGATTGIYAPQKIYIINGVSTLVYDLKSDTWSSAKAMPAVRIDGYASVVLDDTLYVIGGQSSESYQQQEGFVALSATEQYIPLGYSNVASITPEPSGAIPANPEPFLDGTAIAAIGLTAGIVIIAGLVLIKKREAKKQPPHDDKNVSGMRRFVLRW